MPGLRFLCGFYFGLLHALISTSCSQFFLQLLFLLPAYLPYLLPSFLPSFPRSSFPPFSPFPPFPCPRSSFPFTFSCVQFFFSLFMPPTALPSSQYLFFPPFPFFSLFPVMNPSFLVLSPLLVLITSLFFAACFSLSVYCLCMCPHSHPFSFLLRSFVPCPAFALFLSRPVPAPLRQKLMILQPSLARFLRENRLFYSTEWFIGCLNVKH